MHARSHTFPTTLPMPGPTAEATWEFGWGGWGLAAEVFTEESFWLGAQQKPRCALERLALDLFNFHTKAAVGSFDVGRSGAEWCGVRAFWGRGSDRGSGAAPCGGTDSDFASSGGCRCARAVTKRRPSGCTGTRTKPWWMSRASTCTPTSPRCVHWEIGRVLEPREHCTHIHRCVRTAEAAAGARRGVLGDVSQRHGRTHAGAAKDNPHRVLRAASTPARRRAGGALASLCLCVCLLQMLRRERTLAPRATISIPERRRFAFAIVRRAVSFANGQQTKYGVPESR